MYLLRRALKDQRGQVLPWVGFMILCIAGLGGLVTDVGRAYIIRSQLQNSANAAALAASGEVFNSNPSVNAAAYATRFSASPGDANQNPLLGTVTTTVTTKCLNLLMPPGTTCAGNNPQVPNAVQVSQTSTVRTLFMPILFGPSTLTVTATATASMLGQAQPWNIAIVLDATPSMNNTDGNCGNVTEFKCALDGIQTMLGAVSPCAPGFTSCATSNANFHVALFSFPAVTTATVADDVGNCGASPTFTAYSLPLNGATSYSPTVYTKGSTTLSSTYEIVPFSSDYYSATATNHLNTQSALVQAAGGCMSPVKTMNTGNTAGLLNYAASVPYSGITYYASALYAAQAALVAQQAANPGTKNLIIMLSDGQANVPSAANDFPGQQGFALAATSHGYASPGVNGAGVYPDAIDECQQAIKASQDATDAGTRVYAISYGSEDQGCSASAAVTQMGAKGTDSTTIVTGRNAAFTAATITPCLTMENIASSLQYFYSDYNQSGSGVAKNCIDAAHGVTSLNAIFTSLISGLTSPRLLPNNAT